MPRPELTDIRLEGYSSAESRLGHLANSRAEPSPVMMLSRLTPHEGMSIFSSPPGKVACSKSLPGSP